jgi:glycosyltransferase involved in cell wall biosynthesis
VCEPVRIAVDGRSLREATSARGIARYVRTLLLELGRTFPDDEFAVLVPGGAGADAAALEAAGLELRAPRLGGRPIFGTAALFGRPRIDRLAGGCDVVFAPGPAPLAISTGVPLVLTIHDLTFEHRPGDFTAYERAWHRVARPRRLARRAARVISVSEAVRQELLVEWDLPADKVVTVPSGPGSQPGTPAPLPAALPEHYVLVVGALEPRKRPELLLRAHARARAAGLEARLVFAGDGPMRERLVESDAVVLGFVADGVLEALYRNALALVCVSNEEGFAFTPLEAIARGTPAIVSDLPVFAETVAEGALRVPVDDADALASALLRLERDERFRAELVKAGRAALARLSWRQAAIQTCQVLREASRA